MAYAKIVFPFKDPDEVLDYTVDWSDRLGADTINDSSWEMSADNSDDELDIDSDTNTTDSSTVWLSGGTIGVSYELTNRVVTAGGRTMDQTCKIKIKRK
jgi:hypothetical protein